MFKFDEGQSNLHVSFEGSRGGEADPVTPFTEFENGSDYIWEACVFLFVFWTPGTPLTGMIRKMNAVLADRIGKMWAILLISDLKENGNNLVIYLNKQVVLPDIVLFPFWNNLIMLSANFQEAISSTTMFVFVQ